MAKTMVKPKRVTKVTSYKNKARIVFREGDLVRLSKTAKLLHEKVQAQQDTPRFAGRAITQTRIVYLFPDVKGLVRLEIRLGGYWTWSVDDLEKIVTEERIAIPINHGEKFYIIVKGVTLKASYVTGGYFQTVEDKYHISQVTEYRKA